MTVLNKKVVGIPAGAVYVGRGTKWGNTFTHIPGIANTVLVKDRDEACDRHLAKLEDDVRNGVITLQELAALHGKDLVCFCAPLRCHGDNLTKAADWAVKELNKEPVQELKEFKLIVAGGRDFNDYALLHKELEELIMEGDLKNLAVSIVSGMARGADALGARYARAEGIKLYEAPADWNKHGKSAGFKRNAEMGEMADGLLAFWNGSAGTKHMIDFMEKLGKPVAIVRY